MKTSVSTTNKITFYPCLKITTSDEDDSQRFVVMFTGECTGFVVHDHHKVHGLGDYSTHWVEEDFSLFDGQITLEN